MSSLILIRHGQASFFDDDYDRLSAIGEEQSRRLGAYLLKRGIRFDEVFAGPRKRQIDTARLIGEMFDAADQPFLAPVVIDGFDEYDGEGIIRHILPEAAKEDRRIRDYLDRYEKSSDNDERLRSFQKVFEAASTVWLDGAIQSPLVESWRAFHDRVRSGIERLTSRADRGVRIALFTSGGPISIAVQMSLQAPERTAIELNWRLRNCSITEIVFSNGRLSLDSFNGIPHLDDASLITYR